MSLQRFHGIEDMPPVPPVTGADLASRIRAVWRRARLFAPAVRRAQGVRRFRSIEDAQAARDQLQFDRRPVDPR